MLSLSPRADLFVFNLPKDFLPKEIEEKYYRIINKDKSVIRTPIDYLNESIQGIDFPGFTDILVEQKQYSVSHPENKTPQKGIPVKRINIEPERTNVSYNPKNILSQLAAEFSVTFRKNQGLYNYFMIYETIFHKALKEYAGVTKQDDVFEIFILSETGKIMGRIKLFQPRIEGIEGLQFSYNKLERQSETFDVKFQFNNIDFDIVDE